jgi:hypothetical protein
MDCHVQPSGIIRVKRYQLTFGSDARGYARRSGG